MAWLTFDDGLWPKGTKPISDLSAVRDVPATFYIWGASKHEELVRAMTSVGYTPRGGPP
jgi:peptidoglycan/xylan/chitin deacetylase (PgdA/CDA1 family)